MIRLCSFLVLFNFIFSKALFALEDSVSVQPKFKTTFTYFLEKKFLTINHQLLNLDTSTVGIDRVVSVLDLHYNYLGTASSASQRQIFDSNNSPFTKTVNSSYDLELFSSENIASYRINKRFTELKYHSSAFKEQAISIFHSQNIIKNWNAAFLFDRLGVKDFMNYSDTYRSRFIMQTSYNSPGKRYYLFSHIFWNRIKNDVNGGLASDSLFDNTVVSNLGIKGLAYNITGAQEHRRKRTAYLSQYYNLFPGSMDSTGNGNSFNFFLHHRICYERNSFVYTDEKPDSLYYTNFYYGDKTLDSLGSDDLSNRFEIILNNDRTGSLAENRNWYAGIFSDLIQTKYSQRLDSSWKNLALGFRGGIEPGIILPGICADGLYLVDGIDKENYLLNLKVTSANYSFGVFDISLHTSQTSPDLIFRRYDSNNFIWTNDFSPLKTTSGKLLYSLAKYKLELSAEHMQVENYTYLDDQAFPDQFTDKMTVDKIQLKKNFQLGKWHIDNNLVYQHTDHEEVLPLPDFVTDQSLYLEDNYFRSALHLALGVSGNYNSSYYAPAFMPSNGMFYLQTEKKTGGYFRFDFFVNAKIKTAKIFLKMENILDGTFSNSYYLTPHYPMPGRVLRFGILWRFFDQ